MKLGRSTAVGWGLSLVAALSGSVLVGSCATRVKDTIFGSTRNYFLSPQFSGMVINSLLTGIDIDTSVSPSSPSSSSSPFNP